MKVADVVTRIDQRIREITTDPRFAKPGKTPATVFENAPLALMQMGWESEVTALRWVRNMLRPTEAT